MRLTAIPVYTFVVAALLACAPSFGATTERPGTSAPALAPIDQAFLAARDAVRNGDRAKLAQLAPQLASHPLAAYVEYWQLVPRLRSDPAINVQVEEFLARYPGSYIGDRLRLDWSFALADRGDFTGFDREAALLVWNTDDNQFRCYSTLSKYRNASGTQTDVIARDARLLLANTRDSAGEGCLALTEALLADGRISVWERVRALVEQNQLSTAKRVGQRALDAQALAFLDAGLVDLRMHRLPALRVQVVVEGLLQMNQAALARAVGPVLQGGQGDGVGFVHLAGVCESTRLDFRPVPDGASHAHTHREDPC